MKSSIMNTIKEWSDDNNMGLNERKTKEMFISFKREPITDSTAPIVNNKVIGRVTNFNILGVWLSWTHHVHHMAYRTSPRLYYVSGYWEKIAYNTIILFFRHLSICTIKT